MLSECFTSCVGSGDHVVQDASHPVEELTFYLRLRDVVCRGGQRVPAQVRQHVGVEVDLNDPFTNVVRIRTDRVQHLRPTEILLSK